MRYTAKRTSRLLAFGLLVAGAGMAQASTGSALIHGLDGDVYSPYRPSVVEKAQNALEQAGLYTGPANGVLDRATMTALGEFQKQHGIEVTGLPTPRTRKQLFGAQVASATPPAPRIGHDRHSGSMKR